VDTIRDGLIAAKPDCAEQFSANAAAFVDELRSLNAELASQLKPFAGKTFVAYHDFAPYFAERYQLKVAFVVESPELNPTPADLQRVSQLVEQTELKTLLSEPQEGRQSFNALAADLGVKIGVFDPLETGRPRPASLATTSARCAATARPWRRPSRPDLESEHWVGWADGGNGSRSQRADGLPGGRRGSGERQL